MALSSLEKYLIAFFVFYNDGRPRYFTLKLIHQRERSVWGFCKGVIHLILIF